MKKLFILLCFGIGSLISTAQTTAAIDTSLNDSIIDNNDLKYIEGKLIKQEQEIQALKKDNNQLKKEIKQLKSSFNVGNKTKLTISRKGSKQITTE